MSKKKKAKGYATRLTAKDLMFAAPMPKPDDLGWVDYKFETKVSPKPNVFDSRVARRELELLAGFGGGMDAGGKRDVYVIQELLVEEILRLRGTIQSLKNTANNYLEVLDKEKEQTTNATIHA